MLRTLSAPFASSLAEAGAFVRVAPDAPAPDVQFHVSPVVFRAEDVADPEPHGIWISPCLLTPHSRGTVRLASDDPAEKPVIENAFYTAGDDMERMIAGLRLALDDLPGAGPRAVLRRALLQPGWRQQPMPCASTSNARPSPSTIPSAHAGWARTPRRS